MWNLWIFTAVDTCDTTVLMAKVGRGISPVCLSGGMSAHMLGLRVDVSLSAFIPVSCCICRLF